MENTGIAAAGEAGIGGEAGIIGTDRDSGAGGGRDGECGVGSGREEAGLWTDGISAGKPEVKGTGDQAAGGETQGPDAIFNGQMVSCALKGQVNFLCLAVGGWHAIKKEKFCRTKRQTRRAEDRRERAGADAAGGNQFDRDFIPINLPDLETERGFISTDLKFNGDSAVSRCRDRRRRSRIGRRADGLRLAGRPAIRPQVTGIMASGIPFIPCPDTDHMLP